MTAWRGLGHAWWVAMRAAVRQPVTVAWPHERELPIEGAHGSIVLLGARCTAQGACAEACPTGCLTVGSGGELTLDRGACIGCGRCVGACPCGAVGWSVEAAGAVAARGDLISGGARPVADDSAPT